MNYPNSFGGGRDEFTLDWTNRSFTSLVVHPRCFPRQNETSFFVISRCVFDSIHSKSSHSLCEWIIEREFLWCHERGSWISFLLGNRTIASKWSSVNVRVSRIRGKDSLLHDKENRKIAQWIKFPFRFPDSFASMESSLLLGTDWWNRIRDQWRCVEPGIPLQIKRTGEATPSHANQSNILLVIQSIPTRNMWQPVECAGEREEISCGNARRFAEERILWSDRRKCCTAFWSRWRLHFGISLPRLRIPCKQRCYQGIQIN